MFFHFVYYSLFIHIDSVSEVMQTPRTIPFRFCGEKNKRNKDFKKCYSLFFFLIYFEVSRKILLRKREETLNEVVVLRFLRCDVYQK